MNDKGVSFGNRNFILSCHGIGSSTGFFSGSDRQVSVVLSHDRV
jgi:hypothetical protein